MSVRIYQLSKEIGMENAELIALLRERGHEVKSASSTIDNISADSLRQEHGSRAETSQEQPKEAEAPVVAEAPKAPQGAIVRSKEDIERERREREEEEKRKQAARVIPPAPSQPPPLKAPPPLPRGPAVTIRTNPPPPVPAPPTGNRPPPLVPGGIRPPVKPVLRTDVAEKKEEAPAANADKSAAASSAPSAPPVVRPPLKVPPMIKSPRTIVPQVISAPKTMVPPGAAAAQPPSDSDSNTAVPVQPAAAAKELRPLQVKTPIVVRDFALQIGKKPFQLISELMELGIFASMNTAIEEEVAVRIAGNHGYSLEIRHRGEGAGQQPVKVEVKPVDESELQEPRPPVVCILGHVDHGKTTLLDAIRHSNVVKGEAGGITQHIGAYQIEHKNQKITFIDTPGHSAFSNMRARGANTTDIAILVVAADDGFMPQTDEALGHARKAGVPIVIAINKIDAPGSNIDRIKRQLQERELTPEDWGGETLVAEVSALKGLGIDALLDVILLQTEVTEGITANPNGTPEGVVIEAQKELGRGSTASVIVQKGTLKPGMALVCGENYCRVRMLIDDMGKAVKEAGPSTPVKIVGWSETPTSGDIFTAVKNEREAKRIAEENELARKRLESVDKREGGASIEDLFAAIARTQKKTYRVLVKADVYGTAEALATTLMSIKSDKINIDVIDMGVGDITRNDMHLAGAAQCAVIGFNVGLENGVAAVAKHQGTQIHHHNIIYELIKVVKDAMADLLEPELRENKIGAAQVRQVFPLAKSFVAGCMITEGRVQRDAKARLLRKNKVIAEGTIQTLKRFKEDATEVRAGYECGIQLSNFSQYEEGDVIEAFEILKIKPTL